MVSSRGEQTRNHAGKILPSPHRVRKHLPADTYPRALSHAILTGNRYESAERISSIGYNQLGHQMQNFAVFILACKCPSGLAKCAISETQTVTDYVFCCFTQEPLHGETTSDKNPYSESNKKQTNMKQQRTYTLGDGWESGDVGGDEVGVLVGRRKHTRKRGLPPGSVPHREASEEEQLEQLSL